VATALVESATRFSEEAHGQGNKVASESIKTSFQRLRHRCDLIFESLSQTGNRTQPV
jgi:hypothetical protein